MKGQKGITLVALIITIIVLLILAVVTIASINNNKIIDYAKNAKNDYTTAQTNENAKIDEYNAYLENWNKTTGE